MPASGNRNTQTLLSLSICDSGDLSIWTHLHLSFASAWYGLLYMSFGSSEDCSYYFMNWFICLCRFFLSLCVCSVTCAHLHRPDPPSEQHRYDNNTTQGLRLDKIFTKDQILCFQGQSSISVYQSQPQTQRNSIRLKDWLNAIRNQYVDSLIKLVLIWYPEQCTSCAKFQHQ